MAFPAPASERSRSNRLRPVPHDLPGHAVAKGREEDLEQHLHHRAGQGAGKALQERPAEEIPAYQQRENEVVRELRQEGRGVGPQRKASKAPVFLQNLSDSVVYEVI